MTPDEMDKKIEFILQMQAQFEANMSQAEANTHNLRVSVADLKASVATLAGVVRDSIKINDDRFTRFDLKMLEVAEVQKATGERLRELTEKQKALADAQKSSDERLNALISVTERHITGPDHLSRS
jgi:hypothetical protein